MQVKMYLMTWCDMSVVTSPGCIDTTVNPSVGVKSAAQVTVTAKYTNISCHINANRQCGVQAEPVCVSSVPKYRRSAVNRMCSFARCWHMAWCQMLQTGQYDVCIAMVSQ